MTARPEGYVVRLAALIDTKLSDLEIRAAAGEVPSGADLNAVRRLVAWAEQERPTIARPRTDEQLSRNGRTGLSLPLVATDVAMGCAQRVRCNVRGEQLMRSQRGPSPGGPP